MKKIGLIGLPNSGKSAFFNILTNSSQKVANFPGVTVEKKIGKRTVGSEDHEIIDLPGLYTLDAATLDEKVTRNEIINSDFELFILVIDSTNLEKSLYLALQIVDLKIPMIICLNMFDIAKKRGLQVDVDTLSRELKSTVIPTVAVKGIGVEEIDKAILNVEVRSEDQNVDKKNYIKDVGDRTYIKNKLSDVQKLKKLIIQKAIRSDSFTEKLDNIFLHPVFGFLSLMLMLIGIFQLLFVGADPFVGLIESLFEVLAHFVDKGLPDGLVKSLIIDGIIAGVGGIIVFVPHIFFLFILINFMEDFGYLGRAAFLLDFLMRKMGLSGKAVIPLLSSHACAIPGVMAARIIEDRKQRTLTMLLSPLMTCSARLPVYTMLIAAMVPNIKVLGFIGLPGLTMFLLYLLPIVVSFILAFATSKLNLWGKSSSYFMMELPPYRMPQLKTVFLGAGQKAWVFFKKAGTVIFLLTIVIWFLVTFPKAPENASKPEIEYSAAAIIGQTFEPIFKPLGFDWKITTALIPSFAAREVMVSSLGTVLAVDGDDEEVISQKLSVLLANEYTLASLMALIIWFVFSPQCISTIAVLKKESAGYLVPSLYVAYALTLAYLASFITYKVVSLF